MERGTSATNTMWSSGATSGSGPVRTMTYAAHSSGIIYIRPASGLVVMVPTIWGNNYFSNGSATTLLANGIRIFHVSIIPTNFFSYWIPAGMPTYTLVPVMHPSSFFVPLSHISWNWTYPVVNHTPRFARVNHGPGHMPLRPSNFHWVGNVNRGLSREVISARMRRTRYQSTERSASDDDKCRICLDDFSEGQTIGSTDCQHTFHFDCIRRWLMRRNSCPLCRRTALAV